MSKVNSNLTPDMAREYIGIDENLESIVCIKSFGFRSPGDRLGSQFSLLGRRMSDAAAAWALQKGAWPRGQVVRNDTSRGLAIENLTDLGEVDLSSHVMSQSFLRELLRYCPATGIFVWNKTVSTRAKKGDIAGTDNGSGYIKITIGKTQYLAHRLAYLYIYGVMPLNVDHKNGVRSCNMLDNLRSATDGDNQHNRRSASRRSVSGLLGVGTTKSGRYDARIKVGGRRIYLGRFDSADEAHQAYLEKKRELHEFCTI